MTKKRAPILTKKGRIALGELMAECRKAKGWSQDDVVYEVRVATGEKTSKGTISNTENAHTSPSWDTLALLAEVEYITDAQGRALNVYELFDIASERLDPRKPSKPKANQGRRPNLSIAAEQEADYQPEFSMA